MKKAFLFGITGREWNNEEIAQWRSSVIANGKARDYGAVVSRMQAMPASTHIVQAYGDFDVEADHYQTLSVTIGDVKNGNPNILITGGVHGYEPSGVEAATRFAETEAPFLTHEFNFVVYPCISPWAYEHDERWDANARDPNREVKNDGGTREMQFFMQSMQQSGIHFAAAIDLHETSDRDIELRQMRAERFNQKLADDYEHIPQGYYLTLSKGENEHEDFNQLLFGEAIMKRVEQVSPIAPDQYILEKKSHGGIILSPMGEGLMRTYLGNHADLVAVTEVYPDHPDMGFEKSVQAQLASIHGALDYVRG